MGTMGRRMRIPKMLFSTMSDRRWLDMSRVEVACDMRTCLRCQNLLLRLWWCTGLFQSATWNTIRTTSWQRSRQSAPQSCRLSRGRMKTSSRRHPLRPRQQHTTFHCPHPLLLPLTRPVRPSPTSPRRPAPPRPRAERAHPLLPSRLAQPPLARRSRPRPSSRCCTRPLRPLRPRRRPWGASRWWRCRAAPTAWRSAARASAPSRRPAPASSASSLPAPPPAVARCSCSTSRAFPASAGAPRREKERLGVGG
jgi:hypothetical protein